MPVSAAQARFQSVARCWASLVALPRQVLRNPYLAYVVGYSTLFIVAFSNVGNIGILARQRTQLLPILLTLLALQPIPPLTDKALVSDRRANRRIPEGEPA